MPLDVRLEMLQCNWVPLNEINHTGSANMNKLEMRSSLGMMIATLFLAVLPQTAQAEKSDKDTQANSHTADMAAPGINDADIESALWGLVQKAGAKNDYETYLAQYPNGRYAKLAKARLAKLNKMKCIFPNSGKGAPIWLCGAPVEGVAIGAVGSSTNSELGVDFMKQRAVADAREVITRLHFSSDFLVKASENEDKSADAASQEEISDLPALQPIIDQVSQDGKILKDIIGPDGAMYVYIGLDEAAVLKLKKFAAKQSKKFAETNALLAAMKSGNANDIGRLLPAGAEANAKDENGNTLLAIAAKNGHKAAAELLIARGADINAKGRNGRTPLDYAALNGHKEVAGLLIAKGADINARNDDSNSPLHDAAAKGHMDVAELLAAKGADINARDKDGHTPLYFAAYFERKDIAELLISKGADINAKSKISGKGGYILLHVAAQNGSMDMTGLLIANGADVNAMAEDGQTPLHSAVSNGRKHVVGLLIAKGAKVNAADKAGRTPLAYATDKGDDVLAEMLRQHGGK